MILPTLRHSLGSLFFLDKPGNLDQSIKDVIEIGLQHEQQHQELLLTDIKHLFACNPLKPAYQSSSVEMSPSTSALNWLTFPEGLYWIGHARESFSYDNETPSHQVFLKPFQMASRLVTNGDYLEFIAALSACD